MMGDWEIPFLFGMLVAAVLMAILVFWLVPDFNLDPEVADDICQQLTGKDTAVAVEGNGEDYGKLICELPSFDSTQNIIIRENGGQGE